MKDIDVMKDVYAPHHFCHSERTEESLFLFLGLTRGEIPRFARFTVNARRERNDKMKYLFSGACIARNLMEDSEMPDVHISWLAGRTVDQKRKVVEGITKVLMEEAGAKPESTHIVFIDLPHTDFASGGMLVADKNKKT
jgi:4-oxalocrotonate tautomerase